MDPYLGKMLDNRYEILERIGAGGMAIVYKAMCHRLNRLVAIKILRSDLAQDEDFRRRFNAESQAVAQLSSPNIVSVYDVSKGGEIEYIVMELVDGITLKQYMERRGQLNWRESLHFITQIMRGLAHAHSRGIVHRDIKPQNIMVLRDGSVKVADFGIAVLENAAQTLTQQALGSVHYISPEQARGDRTDARSDIYSAGVVLYEMLTGRLPFEGESAVSVAIQHLSSTPPTPRSLNPEIPEQLELICMKAMAPTLDRRYASAEEMIRDLEAFRRDPAVNLDFQMSDLRPSVPDEPTRPLGSSTAAVYYAQPEEEKEDSKTPIQLLVLCGVGIAAILLAVILFRSIFRSFGQLPEENVQETHLVQSVVGYTVEEARELEGVKGVFEILEMGQRPSDEYPAGAILAQDPAANNYRKGENLVIQVWVSSGEETGIMPNVINQTVSQAEKLTLQSLITQFGLTVEAPEADMVYDDDFPAGYIISSEPKEGETLHRGDTIRLVVSKGRPTWVLPSFVDMTLNQMYSQIANADFKISPEVEFVYSERPNGTILSQSPSAGTSVSEGTRISLTASQGPEPPPPDLTMQVIIPLPDDRETAYLEIDRDGERIRSSSVDCTSGSYSLRLTGKGETTLAVYLDREAVFLETVTFVDGGTVTLSNRVEPPPAPVPEEPEAPETPSEEFPEETEAPPEPGTENSGSVVTGEAGEQTLLEDL